MSNPVDALITLLKTRQRKIEIERALMGRADGTVDYPSLPNYVYVRIGGNESQVAIARNVTTPQIKDLPIDVERISDNNRVTYNVLGISKSLNPTMATGISPAIKQVPTHGFSHEFTVAGYDPVNLYPRGIASLRCNAQSVPVMTVLVAFGWYEINGTLIYYAGGTSPTFTADGDSYDVLCINAAGTLSIVAGAHGTWPTGVGGFGGGAAPVFPTVGDGLLAVGCVMVRLNMTTIVNADLTYDPRPQFTKSVANPVSGTGVANRIAVWASASTITSDAQFTYNSTTNVLDVATGKIQSSGDGSAYGLYAGATQDVQWYRSAADVWRTPDSLTIDANLTVTTAATFSARTATRVAYFGAAGLLTDSANMVFDGNQLALPVQGATGGLLLGTDANLYRGAGPVLQTTNGFTAGGSVTTTGGNVIATNGNVTAPLGYMNARYFTAQLDGSAGGYFAGVLDDVSLYRSAADIWRTPDSLTIDANLIVTTAATFSARTATRVAYFGAAGLLTDSANMVFDGNQLALATTGITGGVLVGGDVQWYRSAADVWRTPDSLTIDANLIVTTAATFSARTATRVAYFGAAGLLTDSANMVFDGNQLALATTGITGGLLVGGDVQWYRSAADVWRTPDSVTIDAGLNIGTATAAVTGQVYTKGVAQWSLSNMGANVVIDGARNNALAFLDSASANAWGIYSASGASGALLFVTAPAISDTTTSAVQRMLIDRNGNFGIGAITTFGTSAIQNLRMPGPGSGSTAPPTSSITDAFHLFGADAAAGKAWPSFREEGNTTLTNFIMGVNATQGVSTGTGTVKMNGATSRNSVGWITTNDHTGAVIFIPYFTVVTG